MEYSLPTGSRQHCTLKSQARSDYILGKDWYGSGMVGIRVARNYPPDIFVLRARILIYPNESGHQCDTGGPLSQMGTVNGGDKETGI